jgi:cobalt-zinc-cadmium efflux system outer membrane protein
MKARVIWFLSPWILFFCSKPMLIARQVPAATMPGTQVGPLAGGKEVTPSSEWGLEQLERLATEQSPVLRRDLARIESLRGMAVQVGLYPNPKFDTGNPPVVIAGRDSQFNFGFQQEIVVHGKLKLDRAAAERQVRQAELFYQQNRFDLLTAIRKQFFVTLAAQRRVEVQASLLKVLVAALDTAKSLQKVGEASQIDYLLLSVDYRQVEMNLRRSRALLEGDYKKLAAVAGARDLMVARVTGDLMRLPPEFDEAVLREYLTTLHTSLRIAELDVDRNHVLLRRAQVEPYPNLYAGPAYNFGVQPGNDQIWLNLSFVIPVWNLNQGNIRAARANIREALEVVEVLRNELSNRGADAISRHRAARQVVEQYRTQILPQTSRILKLTQQGLKAGVFDFPRYLQAQRAVVETNNSYLDGLETMWTTAAEVAGLLQNEHFP